MKTVCLILLCISPLAMAGGCMIVRVTDDANGAPVAGAKVSCTFQSGRKMSLGTTDDMGKLLIYTRQGMETLTVSKGGYATFTSNLDDIRPRGTDLFVDVRLVPAGSESSGFPGRTIPEMDR
ncbi:MAG: carboxypeptidase-like regulatory domain-containing protein [Phycisphaerae bacterium]